MLVADLFAGGSGFTSAAFDAGCNVIWAANHNPIAVEFSKLNHSSVHHVCQDLHQCNWADVPRHDLLLASPCCQGHSKAAGLKLRSIKADLSRSTAWAVVSCLEVHLTPFAIIENVTDFRRWKLYKVWLDALKMLGYSIAEYVINLADLGVPQSRVRLFIILTRSINLIELTLRKYEHRSARTIIDFDHDKYKLDKVSKRVKATRLRVENGRLRYGNMFLDAAYGSEKGGRDLNKPLGTVTTINKHSLVRGDYIRPLSISEVAKAQTFSDDYIWPEQKTISYSLIGNAVPPLGGKRIIQALLKAA